MHPLSVGGGLHRAPRRHRGDSAGEAAEGGQADPTRPGVLAGQWPWRRAAAAATGEGAARRHDGSDVDGDRKSVGEGKSESVGVDRGGRRIVTTNTNTTDSRRSTGRL